MSRTTEFLGISFSVYGNPSSVAEWEHPLDRTEPADPTLATLTKNFILSIEYKTFLLLPSA
jgi:hypothetical protein